MVHIVCLQENRFRTQMGERWVAKKSKEEDENVKEGVNVAGASLGLKLFHNVELEEGRSWSVVTLSSTGTFLEHDSNLEVGH